jgi:SAM-dependent methyltransferase
MSEKTFAEYEREGWDRNAAGYDEFDLPLTDQAFTPLLDSIGDLSGRRVLELASGTGHLAARAVAKGATVVGIDAAPNMIELARQNVPEAAEFHEGNAEALPFEDGSFDAVLSSFGFLHFAHPEDALREAVRVLKAGGSLALTVWQAPDKGNEFMGHIHGTVQKHSNLDVDLPPAPPMFALADPEICKPMLSDAGFTKVELQDLPIEVPLKGQETLLEFLLNGAVRGRMLYDRQTPDIQERIRDALRGAAVPYLDSGKTAIPCTAVMVTARKPE